MADIDLELITPTAPETDDAVVVRRGNDPFDAALVLLSEIGGGGIGGSTTVDFGAAPGTGYVTQTVTDAGISAGSRIKVWVQGTTADHNEIEHLIIAGRAGLIAVPGAGSFTIHLETELRLTGEVALKWEAA